MCPEVETICTALHFDRFDLLKLPLEESEMTKEFSGKVAFVTGGARGIGAAYAMSKAALQGLVRGMARDLGPKGITVNNVQPGPTNTDMNPENGEFGGALHGLMAIQRHAHPDEIAGLVAYVASSEAGFVTGANLSIDGGFSA
jgi:NAD(P)-dependent dehydrogenase (short-subunit alcohol dehydrogenase family)